MFLTEWRRARRARIEAAEREAREAQERAWWAFFAAMHAAQGGDPIPYPGDREDR